MTATTPGSILRQQSDGDDSVKSSLDVLGGVIDSTSDSVFDFSWIETVGDELLRLHARMRIHHSPAELSHRCNADAITPELSGEYMRLCEEHSDMIGKLDRLIRSAETMNDRTLEDKEVFVLAVRELIAMVRRHEAEEDRLFYLSIWRETGGES